MGQLDLKTWQIICRAVKRQTRRLGRMPKSQYSDKCIAELYLWSVFNDRPLQWALQKTSHNGKFFRPRKIPSRSQFCRRVAGARFQQLLQRIHADLAGAVEPGGISYFDGKPVTVGVASKDRQAKRGHVLGGFAKGYKLHVWAGADRRIKCWSVMGLNVGETLVAEALIDTLPGLADSALVLADTNYDSQRIYNALAAKNAGLLTKPRGMDLNDPPEWFRRRHPKARESGPVRREALAAWRDMPGVAAWLFKERIHVEGTLSNLCSFGSGLTSLPPWVRGLARVRRWVGAKIIIYHARCDARLALKQEP
jgi:hypothetical protein